MALLGALVLLALSAALATATFSAAHAMRRAALTARTRARVESDARRAVGEVLARWSVALDTMPVGSGADVALAGEPTAAGPPLHRTARVERLGDGLYAVTVDVSAFAADHPFARRRARLWLQRPAGSPASAAADGLSVPPPVVTPWGFVDLY